MQWEIDCGTHSETIFVSKRKFNTARIILQKLVVSQTDCVMSYSDKKIHIEALFTVSVSWVKQLLYSLN